MLDSKIQKLKDHFGISTATDWQGVRPEWILSQDGCGPKTLAYLRLLLAARGLTLKDDRTPEYWQQHEKEARIVEVLGNELVDDDDGNPAAKDRGVICPFTVLIDTAEQQPFRFSALKTDASEGNRPLIVPTAFQALGRYPDSMGDYSLDSTVGGVGRCHVERKSMEDAHSTILGWARKGEDVGRRDRFEAELARLSEMEAGLVVVECSFVQLIANAPQFGRRSAALNARTLHNSVLAYIQDYSVPWLFADDRRMAEKFVFRWLKRWHDKQVELRKADEKQATARKAAASKQSPSAMPPSIARPAAAPSLPIFDSELASI